MNTPVPGLETPEKESFSDYYDRMGADARHGRRRFTRDGDYVKCPRCGQSPAYYVKRVAGLNDWTDSAACSDCGYDYPIIYLEK